MTDETGDPGRSRRDAPRDDGPPGIRFAGGTENAAAPNPERDRQLRRSAQRAANDDWESEGGAIRRS